MKQPNPNQLPYNAKIYVNGIYAEIFWQVSNCQKIAKHYREDLNKTGKGRFHDLLFEDIRKALSGNLFFILVNPETNKYKGISFYKENYYVSFLHLQKRGEELFAVIITIYRTYHATDKKTYEGYLREIKERYRKT